MELEFRIFLACYFLICYVWACFAVYKNMTSYSIKPNFWLNAVTFLLNFIIFPVAFVIAIRTKKIFHKHKWVYHDYVPHTDGSTSSGASYRKCETCNKKQTNW